jgi:hypothetical protein
LTISKLTLRGPIDWIEKEKLLKHNNIKTLILIDVFYYFEKQETLGEDIATIYSFSFFAKSMIFLSHITS